MKRLFAFVLLLILAMGMVACQTPEQSSNTGDTGPTITINHELGETDVPVNPEKIVVFDFGSLDTLDKLGIEVVGVPQGNIPAYLEKYESSDYENVGSLKEPDFEKISEIDPDLIIISGRQSTLYDQLSELAPTVYLAVDTSRYMESFKENLNMIGKIFDKEAEVAEAYEEIEQSISSLQEKTSTSEEEALILLVNDDNINAYGPNSRFGLIHDVFGVKAVDDNIEASTHGQTISFEYVLEQNPDIIYVIDRTAAVDGKSSAQTLVENKLVQNTSAYQNDRIYYLDPDFWYLSGGGLISVSEMVAEINESFE